LEGTFFSLVETFFSLAGTFFLVVIFHAAEICVLVGTFHAFVEVVWGI